MGFSQVVTYRFKYTRLGKNLRFASLESAFDWLAQSGVAIPVSLVADGRTMRKLVHPFSCFQPTCPTT